MKPANPTPAAAVVAAAALVSRSSDTPESPDSAPTLSGVLERLTVIMQATQSDEARLRTAEQHLAELEKQRAAAEYEVLGAMEALELRKSQVRKLRGQLDSLVGSV